MGDASVMIVSLSIAKHNIPPTELAVLEHTKDYNMKSKPILRNVQLSAGYNYYLTVRSHICRPLIKHYILFFYNKGKRVQPRDLL